MATETIVSPGVLLQEIDKSYVTPGVDPSGLAIIGPTVKGPIEIPTLVKNYNEFKTQFGTTLSSASNAYEYYTSLAIRNYFDNGGATALVVRVVNDADNSWTHASSSAITDAGNTGTSPFTLETLGKGDLLNSIGPEYTGGGLHSGSKDNFRWEVGNVNSNAGTFTLTIRRGDDTTNAPLVLEQFTNCSLDPLSENYIARKVGDQSFTKDDTTDPVTVNVSGEFPNKSQYVRVSAVNSPTYQYLTPNGSVATDDDGTLYSDYLPTAQNGTFDGGNGNNVTNGTPLFGSEITSTNIQGLGTGDFTDAISILKNKEEFKFKTLVVPGLNQENHSSTLDTIIANTTFRGDSLFVADMVPYNSTISTVKNESEELDTNYAATYWPWAQVRSVELGRNIWAPASVVIPGVFAKNDSLAAPWFAPAGLTRGGLTNVIKVEKKLSKTQRDDLYTSKVNPLATFPGQGIVVFGQKTLQQATSALDRVNVRRLLLDVKDTIGGFSRKLVFEQNTQQTRDRFVRQVTPYLESLVQRQGVYAFQVKMDGQLNTSDIVDENKLLGQVFLQPTKTAEFVVLDFVITPTGASFTD
jgi:uncharacterized protein